MIETVGDLKELLSQYPDTFPIKIRRIKLEENGDFGYCSNGSEDVNVEGYELSTVHDGVNDVILIAE